MQPSEVEQLAPGTRVWVWIVRIGKGKWWPGVVQSLMVNDGIPHVTVRFESRASVRGKSRSAVFVGISTSRTRFLELRDENAKGGDRPCRVPTSLLRVPEAPIGELRSTEFRSAAGSVGRIALAK